MITGSFIKFVGSPTATAVTNEVSLVLVKNRNAVTATGTDEVKLNVPVEGLGTVRGESVRKFENWPRAGTINVTVPIEEAPLSSTKETLTVASSSFGFAIESRD